MLAIIAVSVSVSIFSRRVSGVMVPVPMAFDVGQRLRLKHPIVFHKRVHWQEDRMDGVQVALTLLRRNRIDVLNVETVLSLSCVLILQMEAFEHPSRIQ